MSIQALSAAMKVDLPTTRKFVLLALANYVDQDWRCWPSQRTLAKDTGLGERSVREHLRVLEADGYITRDHRQRETGFRNSDLITIVVAKLKKNEDQPESPAARKIQPATDDIQPADDYQSNRQEIPPNLSVEPLEEPSVTPFIVSPIDSDPIAEQFQELRKQYPKRSPSNGNWRKAEVSYRSALKRTTHEHIAEQLALLVRAEIATGNCSTAPDGTLRAESYMQSAQTFFSSGWEAEITVPPNNVEDAVARLRDR